MLLIKTPRRPARFTVRGAMTSLALLGLASALAPARAASPAAAPGASAEAPGPQAPQGVIGQWLIIGGHGLEGLRFGERTAQFQDAKGRSLGLNLPYTYQGGVVTFAGRKPGKDGQVETITLTLQPDGRLSGDLQGVGTVSLRRLLPVAAKATKDEDQAAQPQPAKGAVARLSGLYELEGQPGTGLDFAGAAVRFVDDGQVTAEWAFSQQGARVAIADPQLDGQLVVLDDGRLRLTRENMRAVFYRKARP